MIRLNQLVRLYEGHIRLHVDQLTLAPGLILLVGKNGAGKSTLLRLLATADFPDGGEISYLEGTVKDQLPQIRSRIGYVPTDVELHEDMTPIRLMNYMCLLKGADPLQGEQLLRELHLEDVKRKRIESLSQGMKQRLAIGQALLGSPRYLLLDEPLNYLDSIERKTVIRLLYRHARGSIVLIAAHELNEWQEADRLLWLNAGKPEFYGTPGAWRQVPLGVWQGVLPHTDACPFDEACVMIRKLVGDHIEWRVFSRECPAPGFVQVPLTTEDAYFIRSRRLL
ncbi:ATP-binding cassette domain-containing protein [Paenibacillus sp. GbtcB18]|uniref:ATP-binding cassette domain-containing protein n=1 Tax=Paenibacillus sp. GbtcB18 TaxID=2824763 RepID=UPI001C2F2F5A|nr:ABC transporter ATP-binding protein [Paenibacillus sp. GbtcB18]